MRLIALGALVVFAGLVEATRADAQVAAAPNGQQEVRACPGCGFPYPQGTVNCWACGSHLADLKLAGFDRPINPVVVLHVRLLPEEAAVPFEAPEVAFAAVEKWIADHPERYDEAIEKIEALRPKLADTELDMEVDRLIAEVKARKDQADRPMSAAEREAMVVTEMLRVTDEVASNPSLHRINVGKLENLLKLARGTAYEETVRSQLNAERAKLRP